MINDLGLILSTGRTGTLFFQDYINETSPNRHLCLHEPNPSRRFIPLSNMVAQGRISNSFYCRNYFACRKKIFENLQGRYYVESNNFLWSGVEALNSQIDEIRILHIVRHPEDYIVSHYNFGFWAGKKKFIRTYAPYFKADLPLSKHESRDPLLVLASRWNLINRKIRSYQKTNPYLFVKFEDLFSKDSKISLQTVNKVRTFFNLELVAEDTSIKMLSKPKNKGVIRKSNALMLGQNNVIIKYIDDLMDFYGYQLTQGQL